MRSRNALPAACHAADSFSRFYLRMPASPQKRLLQAPVVTGVSLLPQFPLPQALCVSFMAPTPVYSSLPHTAEFKLHEGRAVYPVPRAEPCTGQVPGVGGVLI